MEDDIKTIEALGRLMKRTMATKEDVGALRTEMKQEFAVVHSRLDHLDARVGRTEADVHTLSGEMVHRREFEDVLDRVTYYREEARH